MCHQISVNGETVLPVRGGAALIASKTQPGAWHAVRLDRCDCDGFTYRRTCRHIRAPASYLNLDEPVSIDDGECLCPVLALEIAWRIGNAAHRGQFMAGYLTAREARS